MPGSSGKGDRKLTGFTGKKIRDGAGLNWNERKKRYFPVHRTATRYLRPRGFLGAFFCDLARSRAVLVRAMVDIERLFRRLGMGVVPGRERRRLVGLVWRMGQGMVRGMVPGIFEMTLPILAGPAFWFRGRVGPHGFCRLSWCHRHRFTSFY